MPRKIRQLLQDLRQASFGEVRCSGSHHTFKSADGTAIVLAYHKEGQDAKPYQEREVAAAICKSRQT